MKLEMARFLNDREQLLYYLAQQNVVPVKAPLWAKHPFALRRRITGTETTPLVMECLGVHDEQSCKQVRERIKQLRRSLVYKQKTNPA